MKLRSTYAPLVLALFFGLAVSFIPGGPVLGSAASQPALAITSLNNVVRYSHTLMVGSNGTPTQNGTALLAAMDTISNSNPSASNPYLLKLEPGNYDLISQSLILKPYVDLEGSGEGTTIISSTVGNTAFPPVAGTLVAASNSEVRFLKVANSGPDGNQDAVYIPAGATNTRFDHLAAIASGGADSYGIYNSTGTITLTNSLVNASAGTGSNVGIYNNTGGTIFVTYSSINASGVFGDGIFNLATAFVASSQLSGSNTASAGLTVCPYSYTTNFATLTNGVCH